MHSASAAVQAALTLIEILIAMFIFLIGILGILAVFPVAMNSAGRAIGETRTNVLAQTVLAQVSADWKCPYYTGDGNRYAAERWHAYGRRNRPAELPGILRHDNFHGNLQRRILSIGQSRIITGISPSASNRLHRPFGLPGFELRSPRSPRRVPAPTRRPGIHHHESGAAFVSGRDGDSKGGTSITCNLACRAGQWDGYYLVFTKVASGNWIGISRQIVSTAAATVNPTPPPNSPAS